ncbi:hypothetical protein BTA51_15990 [Hahella sp. CCB-MM4]|nr:hypothetical protein BTA51_15990 [Hahella sp. CCB-MM4]
MRPWNIFDLRGVKGAGTALASKITAIIFLFFISLSGIANAVQPDSKGTDFWLMFNGNLPGSGEVVNLYITGDIATNGTVSIPGLAFSSPFAVVPGTVTTVNLPLSVRMDTSDFIESKGVHVVANDEVTVYGLNRRTATTDAFLGLPTDILGTEYINQGYANVNIVNATQFGIVASQDTTTVTITPTATTGPRTAGVPYNIVLNQGQTYQLRNGNAAPADLSGTIITSDKPIAVFGSHQCANIPQGFIACDHIVEQLPPTSTWGQAFVTYPLATRTNGDTIRVLASNDVTSVSINGAPVAVLNRGDIYETVLAIPARITADKAVLVTQYSNSSSYDNVTSDPFEVVVPPFEQFLSGYTITTPASGFSLNFVNVVVPNAAVGAVTLDGVPIPAGSYTAIGASGFSGASVAVALGSHNLTGPLPFGLTSYGFDSFDSYGYPGGLALAAVAELTNLTLTPPTATNPVNTEHCVVATTTDQNDDPLVGIRVDFNVSGANTASGFIFTDTNGEAEFCYTGTNVGFDSIVATVGNLSATARKEWVDAQNEPCDVDGDGDIDRMDLREISLARGQIAEPGDPRDANGDGVITPSDVKVCIPLCTRPSCAVQ